MTVSFLSFYISHLDESMRDNSALVFNSTLQLK
jgi:hypothetical protein